MKVSENKIHIYLRFLDLQRKTSECKKSIIIAFVFVELRRKLAIKNVKHFNLRKNHIH